MVRIPKNRGLELAQAHSSARARVPSGPVYRKIEDALAIHTEISAEAKQQKVAHAIRAGLSRVERLGELLREDYRIAPRDELRMEQEAEYLKGRILKIAGKTQDVLRLAHGGETAPVQKGRVESLVESVFDGTAQLAGDGSSAESVIKLTGEVASKTQLGSAIDGTWSLIRSGSLALTSSEGIEEAVDIVRSGILQFSRSALNAQTSGGGLSGAFTLLMDGK